MFQRVAPMLLVEVVWAWKTRGPENDEHWLNQISQIMDMKSITVEEH